MECRPLWEYSRFDVTPYYIIVSLSGPEKLAQIGELLESLLGGNAEYNAVIAELLSIVDVWPSLSAAARAKILKMVVALSK